MILTIIAAGIALGASVIGSICGVGGGVLMKPLLDLTGVFSISTASFLSGTTVLAMTGYNTIRNLCAKNSGIDMKKLLPLAFGAAVGGMCGQKLFRYVRSMTSNGNTAGTVQSLVLFVLVAATLVYTLHKNRITPHLLKSVLSRYAAGMGLGIVSSFLGIGGGPFNLAVLHYFFGQDTKEAVQSSLFVILFSQLFSLITTLSTGSIPEFQPVVLMVMVCGGILGGTVGKKIGKKLDGKQTDRLFIGLIIVIMFICAYNIYRFIS